MSSFHFFWWILGIYQFLLTLVFPRPCSQWATKKTWSCFGYIGDCISPIMWGLYSSSIRIPTYWTTNWFFFAAQVEMLKVILDTLGGTRQPNWCPPKTLLNHCVSNQMISTKSTISRKSRYFPPPSWKNICQIWSGSKILKTPYYKFLPPKIFFQNLPQLFRIDTSFSPPIGSLQPCWVGLPNALLWAFISTRAWEGLLERFSLGETGWFSSWPVSFRASRFLSLLENHGGNHFFFCMGHETRTRSIPKTLSRC